MRVAQVLLDLDFATDLFLAPGFDDFGFVETFEGEDVLWFALRAHHVDTSKFAFTQWPSDIERV